MTFNNSLIRINANKKPGIAGFFYLIAQ